MKTAHLNYIPNALTIAGSDSGGGAGIQADLKAFSAQGVYGASVITAVTAQNTTGVSAVHIIPPDVVAAQIQMVLDDIRIDAIKIGMLGNAATISAVAEVLHGRAQNIPIVLDPVMISKSGAALLAPEAVAALKTDLLPLVTLITPNLPEAAELAGRSEPNSRQEMTMLLTALAALGVESTLLKGGHLTQDADALDLLWHDGQVTSYSSPRIPTHNTHGTGCTLSASIAAALARGMEMVDAIDHAKQFVTEAIRHADRLSVGQGHGPLHHFYRFWPDSTQATHEQ